MYSFERIKEELTIENVLSRISELALWRHYLGTDFKVGKAMCAPYRKDKNPSFNVFYSFKRDKYLATDYARGKVWDIFDYVQMIYYVDLYTALVTINLDFDLGLDYNPRKTIGSRVAVQMTDEQKRKLVAFEKKTISEIEIQVTDRGYNKNDGEYWLQYGIGSKLLRDYNVIPVGKLFIDKSLKYTYDPLNPCYAYLFPNTTSWRDKAHFKCYWPLGGIHKWKGNITNEADIQGYDQCDVKGSTTNLVLTKSMKDVMCLRVFGIEAMAIHGETQKFNPDFIRHIRKYYTNIICLYDRDQSGVLGAKYLWKQYKIAPVFIPKGLKCKDFSDVYKVHGRDVAQVVANILLYEFGRLVSP